MPRTPHYAQPKGKFGILLNQWDVIILIVFFGSLAALVYGAQQMTLPYQVGEKINITLSPKALPQYALSSVIRMGIALVCSFIFTFSVGTLAAKSKRAERIILPFIDIMQSVPVLGFLSITLLGFIYLFPGRILGPECAAIFAIFTSQVWNMALSFYQSLRTLPKDLKEAASMFHLRPWQKFWRIEVPFATPSLLWNTMMSLSAGWFFVVASEAISVANQHITLPGIGSYIMVATEQSNYSAIAWAIVTMLLVILLYDQLIFRPLLVWSEKFKAEPNEEVESRGCWFLTLLQRAHLSRVIAHCMERFKEAIISLKLPEHNPYQRLSPKLKHAFSRTLISLIQGLIFIGILLGVGLCIHFIYKQTNIFEIGEVFFLGLVTTFKVTVLILISSAIWVPIGVWIGLRPKVAQWIQPVAQFLAAFPANLVYPVIFWMIMTYHLNVDIWSSPLMILGTQWYILFNVIAGTTALPLDIKLAAQNYGVTGWLWWRKLILPGIFPYYVTGAMTAAGGCWNASIVADVVTWGDTTLRAVGLGGYITQYTQSGDFPRIALGIGVMCLYVTVINRLVWRKLYDLSENRYAV